MRLNLKLDKQTDSTCKLKSHRSRPDIPFTQSHSVLVIKCK